MFSLVDYVKKEKKNQILNEKYDYFNALSVEAKEKVRSYTNRGSGHLGKNSKVGIIEYDPIKIYDLITSKQVIMVFVRYGQDELLYIYKDWNDLHIDMMEDLEEINDKLPYGSKFERSTPKTSSGFARLCNNLCLFLVKQLGIKKNDIVKKMNFQVVYQDASRPEINQQRAKNNIDKENITVNNITTPSNQAYDTRGNHSKLRERLKQYIENKMPNIENINDIPKDTTKLIDKKFQFKLLGNVYKFSDSERVDADNLMRGVPFGLFFKNDNYNTPTQNKLLPEYIAFAVKFANNKFEVINIYGREGYVYNLGNSYKTLDDYIKEKAQHMKEKEDFEKSGTIKG